MPLHLRDGVRLDNAVQQLRECKTLFGNVQGGSAGTEVSDHQNRYLSDVETVDGHLRNIFSDPGVWNHLYGDRYWAIRSLTSSSIRPMPLINDEAADQGRYIEYLMDRLKRFEERLSGTPGEIAVLDTHVLLHYMPPSQIDWCEVLKLDTIRLVLPLRVVEELDMTKYRVRDDLADRARRLLSDLWKLLAPTGGAPAPVPERPGVTIEVPVDDEPRQRSLDADEEILGECMALKAVGTPVRLVTGDTGMSIRATARGIPVVQMPDKYLRRRPTSDSGPGGI
ncbi:MAG: PIN domain-containing protein [Acidimicrobiales bacterium]